MQEELTSVKDELNLANLAIRKYFSIVNDIGVGTAESVIEQPKQDAINAIMNFANAKRAKGETRLTPYEEYCLGVMDAANTVAAYKIDPETVKKHHKGGCTCGQCKVD
jgi:hypothetical protein